MNANPTRFPLARLPWARAICFAAAVAVAQLTVPISIATADIIDGVYSSVTEGTTTAFSPFVYSGTNFISDGGEGATSAGLNIYDSTTNGMLYGFSGTQVDSPCCKASLNHPAQISQLLVMWERWLLTNTMEAWRPPSHSTGI